MSRGGGSDVAVFNATGTKTKLFSLIDSVKSTVFSLISDVFHKL